MSVFAPHLLDSYKLGHVHMYPPGTTRVYSNWTPRKSRIDGVDEVVFFGLQAFLQKLATVWQQTFFSRPKEEVMEQYRSRVDKMVPGSGPFGHIEALHDLGYLPLRFRALPEGTSVPLRVPMFTVENTHPDFAWLVNYIETFASAELWLPMTTATQALHMRRMLDRAAASARVEDDSYVDFQAHDFSYRGMASSEAAAASSAGHLLCFAGTDTVPALDWIEQNYGARDPDTLLGASVPATEHSVMCAGGQEDELETFSRLLDQYPTGILSVVSDTWNLWKVVHEILPALKEKILARDGRLVIRPDSGDPEKILCGHHSGNTAAERLGVVPGLLRQFPGERRNGFNTLDPHVGVIYGDAITYERARHILRNLRQQNISPESVVFGVGSYTYQMVTRDTFGFAMKATWAEVLGEGRDIWKRPVTDDGEKFSARGRLAVVEQSGTLVLLDQELGATLEDLPVNLMREVWKDGNFTRVASWEDVVSRVGVRKVGMSA